MIDQGGIVDILLIGDTGVDHLRDGHHSEMCHLDVTGPQDETDHLGGIHDHLDEDLDLQDDTLPGDHLCHQNAMLDHLYALRQPIASQFCQEVSWNAMQLCKNFCLQNNGLNSKVYHSEMPNILPGFWTIL